MTANQKPIILMVDDVPKNLQVLGTLLAKFDCELAVAMNGQQALSTVEKINPDLILLDVMMPVMDGHETCKRLKDNPNTKDIPVIFLSAKTETEDIVAGFDLGAVDYISKPFIGSELIARVKTHLELKDAKRKLEEEVGTKNKFFSIMSHDLRGAFGIIMSFVQLIQENREYLSQEEIDELLDDIGKTSTNTLELLENLLKWARSQTGAIQFSPEALSPYETCKEIIDQHLDIAVAKEIKLHLKDNFDKTVFADINMVLVVLRNLISNAIKFTPKGGDILLCIEKDNDYVKISVKDTGVGIPSEHLNNLFHIDKKTTTQGTENEQGNGLGLILCKEFVEYNKGQISVQSEVGQGTTISFTLPVAP